MSGLFPPLPGETRQVLNRLPELIDKTFPIPGRFRQALPGDVAELSRLLTSGRTERSGSYLGKPALLSAYLHYFLPWNIYRLCRLLSPQVSLGTQAGMGNLSLGLKANSTINDLGSGPLTLAAALWISRSDLRSVPLEFRCMDRTPAVLEAGKKLFAALTAHSPCPWKLRTIRGEVKRNGTLSAEIRGKPAGLSAAVNMYNELFWSFSPLDSDGLTRFAENHARLLSSLTDGDGFILVAEPGIPRSGEFISSLRSALLKEGRVPISPCTHALPCPLPGTQGGKMVKSKWCHFAFDTDDAPEELHKLSLAAGIPKERAVFSFILAGAAQDGATSDCTARDKIKIAKPREKTRIISDSFPVGGGKNNNENIWGRYGCSERGLVLITGNKKTMESSPSGALEELAIVNGKTDSKSGALLAEKNRC